MKLYIPTNLGWYLAALIIVGPFILVIFLDSDWTARLLGNALFFFGLPMYGLWYALGPRKNLGKEGKTIWPEYVIKRFGDKVYTGTRALIIFLVGIMLYLLTIPFSKDVILVLKNEAPIYNSGKITYIKNTLFIYDQIVFNSQTVSTENTMYANYFPTGHLMFGNSYEFVYLPNSHIILDAKPTSSVSNQ